MDIDTREFEVECTVCDWSRLVPGRERAEHIKRVHENEFPDHAALIEHVG